MDDIHIVFAICGGVILLVIGVAIIWSVQYRRALQAMSNEQKQRLAAIRTQRDRDKRLFWIPFGIFMAIAGGTAGALETRVGFLDVVVAGLLASLFASVVRRRIARREKVPISAENASTSDGNQPIWSKGHRDDREAQAAPGSTS